MTRPCLTPACSVINTIAALLINILNGRMKDASTENPNMTVKAGNGPEIIKRPKLFIIRRLVADCGSRLGNLHQYSSLNFITQEFFKCGGQVLQPGRLGMNSGEVVGTQVTAQTLPDQLA